MNLQTCFIASSNEGWIMAPLINTQDWKNHPLGEITTWPQPLHNFVSTMLASNFPMYLAWGEEGYSFYNDRCIPFLIDKHPGAIGERFESIWGKLSLEMQAVIGKRSINHRLFNPQQQWSTPCHGNSKATAPPLHRPSWPPAALSTHDAATGTVPPRLLSPSAAASR